MLVLVPTQLELRLLWPELEGAGAEPLHEWSAPLPAGDPSIRVACCGFGVAVAGARSAALLARTRARHCALVGLAGTLRPHALPVGAVLVADAVMIDGIGVGHGPTYIDATNLAAPLGDEIRAQVPPPPVAPPGIGTVGSLLTVAAASASDEEARDRAARHPSALAEEMEAGAVLAAASITRTELTILRGISNVAGQRARDSWRVAEAGAALRTAIERWARWASSARSF